MVRSKQAENKSNFLCKLSTLADPSSKSFSIKKGRKKIEIFIVRKGDKVFAYEDVCPHAQAPLEWNKDEFLDKKKENIICAMHGAVFTIEEGQCVSGPCGSAALTPVQLEIIDGDVFYL